MEIGISHFLGTSGRQHVNEGTENTKKSNTWRRKHQQMLFLKTVWIGKTLMMKAFDRDVRKICREIIWKWMQ